MTESHAQPKWTYVKSVDLTNEWYPPTFGVLIRYRSIVTATAVQALTALISAGLGYWVPAAAIVVVAMSVAVALLTVRMYCMRRIQADDALHEITHNLRDAVDQLIGLTEPKARETGLRSFHQTTAENVARFFQVRSGDTSIGCVIRLARTWSNGEDYITVARSSGLQKERDAHSQPLRQSEGIAKALLENDHEGAFIIRDINAAVKDKIWKSTPNDDLHDARTWLICPINGWHGGSKSMLGIIHLTSRRDAFRPSDWVPAKAIADLLGLVYPFLYDPETANPAWLRVQRAQVTEQVANSSVDPNQDPQLHGGQQ